MWSTNTGLGDKTFTQAFTINPDYPRLTFFPLLFFFFPLLDHIWLSCILSPCHTFLLQNHLLLLNLREHYVINLLWISRWNTRTFSRRIFCSKVVWRCNLVKVHGQQPQYQRVPSSVTMWQLFHKEPSVSSWHHKLLTRQLLPIYMP